MNGLSCPVWCRARDRREMTLPRSRFAVPTVEMHNTMWGANPVVRCLVLVHLFRIHMYSHAVMALSAVGHTAMSWRGPTPQLKSN